MLFSFLMDALKRFFKNHDIKPTPWAAANGIAASVISRALNGRGVSPLNALRIEQATDGEVTRDELLFPELHKAKYSHASGCWWGLEGYP